MAQPLQVLPNIAKMEGSPINPPKHYGNRSCLSAGAPANPTQTQTWRKHAGIDGAMAQPSNLEIFQRFCMAASGNSIKKQRSKISISGLRDSWHRWCNQLWKRAWDVTEVSNSQMSAPSMRALSKWAEPSFSQSFGIKNSCIDGINPTYSPHLEILHFKHTSNFQFQICEILGIRGATRHDTPLWCHAEFWCQNTQKPAPSILYAHFRSGAESSTFNMV